MLMPNKRVAIIGLASIFLFSLSLGSSIDVARADEIEDLKKRLEYLEQRNKLDIQLKSVQQKIYALEKKFSDVLKPKSNIESSQSSSTKSVQSKTKPTGSQSAPTKSAQKQTQRTGKGANFNWIMMSISKETREIVGIMGGASPPQPFRFTKWKDGKWYITHASFGQESLVSSAGTNKISWVGFPAGWPINGTWAFTKTASNCALKHTTEKTQELNWNCGN